MALICLGLPPHIRASLLLLCENTPLPILTFQNVSAAYYVVCAAVLLLFGTICAAVCNLLLLVRLVVCAFLFFFVYALFAFSVVCPAGNFF